MQSPLRHLRVQYFEVIAIAKASTATKRLLVRRPDSIFVLSPLIATGEPALILFTLGLTVVAVIATVLWTLYAAFLLEQDQKLRIS